MPTATDRRRGLGLGPALVWPGILTLVAIVVGLLMLARPPAPLPVPAPPVAGPVVVPAASAPPAAASAVVATPVAPAVRRATLGRWRAPAPVRQVAGHVLANGGNEGLAFVVIDKRNARLYVIGADGGLIGSAPVLLGAARGDDTVPGIGERPMAGIQPHERTTPAGRFVAAAGVNTHGEEIVWIDYDAAVSMHRVRVVDPAQRRLQRLASASPADNRISYGCVNIPTAFFDAVIAPMFRRSDHAVYVLPEVRPLQEVFPGTPVAGSRHAPRPPDR